MNPLVKLFCLPYAGGSSALFNKWRIYFDKRIHVHPVELSGRGRRIYDPLYPSISEAVEDVYRIISPQLTQPWALYGHSLGALIAYELAVKISNTTYPPPSHLFVSGRGAPTITLPREKYYHQLPLEDFKQEIISLGGTPEEFFQHPELMEALLPSLRNDFRISELYQGPGPVQPLAYDISVFIGKTEELTPQQVHEWRTLTSGRCSIHYFAGGHFFIHQHTAAIVSIINKTLLT